MVLTSGMKLGPYEIIELLGTGGMGEVYRARDARLDRSVAIKILPAAFSAESDLGTHSLQNADRLLGDFPQLCIGQISGSWNFTFDDEFGHGRLPTRIYGSKQKGRLRDGLAALPRSPKIAHNKRARLPWIFDHFRSR